VPRLPSGLDLILSCDALIEPDVSWFDCPRGHFWYWTEAERIGSARGPNIFQIPTFAKAPDTRADVRRFIRVLELDEDGKYQWRGEWLVDFPRYLPLDRPDLIAWRAWIDGPEAQRFMDQAIERCARLAFERA